MDERRASKPEPVRRKRASKGQVRAFAWGASALSFVGALASLTLSPKPAQGAAPVAPKAATPRTRPVVMIITKKIVYAPAARPVATASSPIHYVYSAPSAPPAAVSCGTTPC